MSIPIETNLWAGVVNSQETVFSIHTKIELLTRLICLYSREFWFKVLMKGFHLWPYAWKSQFLLFFADQYFVSLKWHYQFLISCKRERLSRKALSNQWRRPKNNCLELYLHIPLLLELWLPSTSSKNKFATR